MKDNGRTPANTYVEYENIIGMELVTKATGKITKLVVKAYLNVLTEILLMVIGTTTNFMVMEFIPKRMVRVTVASGLMTYSMVLEKKFGLMEASTKVIM